MILTVPELEQPVFGHRPMTTGRGAVQAHTRRLQVIHPQQLLVQGPFKRGPARIVTQGLQDPGQPVVAQVQGVGQLPGAAAQRVEPLLCPGFPMVQPMVRFRPG